MYSGFGDVYSVLVNVRILRSVYMYAMQEASGVAWVGQCTSTGGCGWPRPHLVTPCRQQVSDGSEPLKFNGCQHNQTVPLARPCRGGFCHRKPGWCVCGDWRAGLRARHTCRSAGAWPETRLGLGEYDYSGLGWARRDRFGSMRIKERENAEDLVTQCRKKKSQVRLRS